jgi:hypothetical protein
MAGSLIIGLAGSKGMSGTTGGTATVNLLTSLEVYQGGFGYKTDKELMWTTFDLVSTLPDADFRYEVFKLDQLREKALDYSADATFDTPVYLRWASDGETVRQTVIYDMDYEIIPEAQLGGMLGHNAAKMRLAVQHAPYWEAATAISYTNVGTVADHGGMIGLSNSNVSAQCRISSFTIDDSALYTPSGQRNKFWVGIRDYRQGTTGFIPKWECELGTTYTDASDGTISMATNGTAVNVTFATDANMVKRFDVKWSNITTANYDDIIGRYLVLARTKLSGTAVEIAAELKYGWLGMSGLESSAGVTFLSGTAYSNWNYVPMGVVDIPPTGDRDSVSSSGTSPLIKQFGFALYAERLGTSGSASWDNFILVPTDHLMTITQAAIDNDTGKYLVAYTGDDDISYVINKMGFTGAGNVEYTFENWTYPVEGGVAVIVAQGSAASATAGHTILSYDVIPRFRTFRGTV